MIPREPPNIPYVAVTGYVFDFLGLLPVRQTFQLFCDFDQSLKPPLIVGYSGAIFRAERIPAVLFDEFSYFLSQFLDTLCDGWWHNDDLKF
jgi:hypothetical protein